MGNPLELSPPEKLFLAAVRHNWDDGTNKLAALLRRKICDRGTALYIYWHGAPEFHRQWSGVEDVPRLHAGGFAFSRWVESLLVERDFPELIRWDPSSRVGIYDDIAHAFVRELPPQVLRPSGGSIDGQALIAGRRGPAALNTAARDGDLAGLEQLLADGAPVDHADQGWTPLSTAAARGRAEVVKWLLGRGAEPRLKAKANAGFSPLHCAVTGGAPTEVLRLLIDAGADVDQKAKWSRRPLHTAATGTSGANVELLIAHGATLDARDSQGQTALHLCAEHGHPEVLAALLDGGCDVQATDKAGQTALHRVARARRNPNRRALLEALLDRGLDPEQANAEGETPIELAEEHVAYDEPRALPEELADLFARGRR